MFKRIILIMIIISTVINIYSNNTINTIKDELIPQLFILETKRDIGKFTDNDFSSFLEYDSKALPDNLEIPDEEKMRVIKFSFKINEKLKDDFLSLYVGPTASAINIYLNEVIIGKQGRYGKEINTAVYESRNYYLSNDILNYGDIENIITIEIFSYKDNTPLSTIRIASIDKNNSSIFWRKFFNVTMVQANFFSSLIIGIFFIFLFFMKNMKEKSYFFFSLFCFSFGLSYANMAFQYDSNNEHILEIFSRVALPFTLYFLSLFTMDYTKILNKNKFIKILIPIPIIILSIIKIIKYYRYEINQIFPITTNLVITPLLIFVIVLLVISLIKDKKKGSAIILSGMIIVIFMSLYDIIYINMSIIPYCYLVNYGYVALILFIFFLLSYEQSILYKVSIMNSIEIEKKNSDLGAIFKDITELSLDINNSNNNLKANIDSAKEILDIYKTQNIEVSDKIISQFKNIEAIFDKLENKINESGRKMNDSIVNQTSSVEEINATLMSTNDHIESTTKIVLDSNSFANKLANVAKSSSEIIEKSKESINSIEDYSHFLYEVMNTLEDVTSKTNLLSINASIEAARAGQYGKGFAIVSQEIRELSSKSKQSLDSSFVKIKEMSQIIKESSDFSSTVSEKLFEIIENSKKSAEMITNITEHISHIKEESKAILDGSNLLLEDTLHIKDLNEIDQNENRNIIQSLNEIKEVFINISELIKNQNVKQDELQEMINSISDIMNQNLKNVDQLKSKVID